MNKHEEEKEEVQESLPPSPFNLRDKNLGAQLLGAVIGALIAFFVLRLGVHFGWHPANESVVLLLGATLGSILSDLERFDNAGSRLTGRKSDGNRRQLWVNVVVAVLGMLVLVLGVFGLMYILSYLFQR